MFKIALIWIVEMSINIEVWCCFETQSTYSEGKTGASLKFSDAKWRTSEVLPNSGSATKIRIQLKENLNQVRFNTVGEYWETTCEYARVKHEKFRRDGTTQKKFILREFCSEMNPFGPQQHLFCFPCVPAELSSLLFFFLLLLCFLFSRWYMCRLLFYLIIYLLRCCSQLCRARVSYNYYRGLCAGYNVFRVSLWILHSVVESTLTHLPQSKQWMGR